jgi:hypothetical protein
MDMIAKSLTIDNNYLSIDEFAEEGEVFFTDLALRNLCDNEEYDYYSSTSNGKRGADIKPRFTLRRFLAE